MRTTLLDEAWVIPRTSCDGIGNVMKAYISALSVNPKSVIHCNPEYRLGRYDLVLHPAHVLKKEGDADLPRFYTCRLLVLKEEELEQPLLGGPWNVPPFTTENREIDECNFYSSSTAVDWNYHEERLCLDLRERVDRVISSIKFLPEILDQVAALVSQGAGPILGISVRTWRAPHETGVEREYDPRLYFQAIDALLPSTSSVLLSVDCHDEIDIYLRYLQGKTVVTVLQWPEGDPTQEAFVKMLALARCAHVIGARESTFTELIYWFSGRKAKMHPLH